jgi:tetratricopeptide (TPR) repeat protein
MSISAELRQKIDFNEADISDESLSKFLGTNDWNLSDLAALGVALVHRSKFDLAMKVFAKWTEVTPNNPEPWTNLGLCLARQRKVKEARDILEYALEMNPAYLPALNNLSEVYQQLGDHDRQLKNCLLAVNQDPRSALAFNNLGTAFVDMGMFQEAKHAFETCLLLDPSSFEAGFNLAKIASREGDSLRALQYLEKAKVDIEGKSYRQADLLDLQLGIEYLICGRLKEGWKLYEKGFSSDIPASLARAPKREFSVPTWKGQDLLPNEKLMVWREQGIGDELRFSTLLPELKKIGGQIIVECDPRLVDAFQRSFPTFHVRASPADPERIIAKDESDFDFQIPMGSLPGHYMHSPEIFDRLGGYLQSSVHQVKKFKQRLSLYHDFKKVGICWRSHQLSATRNKKYTVLEDWGDILSAPNTVFVNLQYGDCEQELADAEQRHGIKILRWADTDLKDDLEAVFGLMQNLDLVISPSTAVVPLAGAIGRQTIFVGHPTWAMLGKREKYPWFSSVHPVLVEKSLPVASGLPEAKYLMDRLMKR